MVRRNGPKNAEAAVGILNSFTSRQCSSTPVGFGQGFLSKEQCVTTLEHPPYSRVLAAADFNLFPLLKSALNGRLFSDATDIIKNATEELKRLLQNDFQERFRHLYCR